MRFVRDYAQFDVPAHLHGNSGGGSALFAVIECTCRRIGNSIFSVNGKRADTVPPASGCVGIHHYRRDSVCRRVNGGAGGTGVEVTSGRVEVVPSRRIPAQRRHGHRGWAMILGSESLRRTFGRRVGPCRTAQRPYRDEYGHTRAHTNKNCV
jgi:hypothetical protein